MVYGAMGKILWVNLSSGEMSEETLDKGIFRKYLGGYGLGAKILHFVETNNGCQDTLVVPVSVDPSPVANFNFV